MKKLLFLTVAILTAYTVNAQEALINTKPGTVLEYSAVNTKGNQISPKTQIKVVSASPKKGGTEVKFETSIFNNKGESTPYTSYSALVKDGVVKYDKNSMKPGGMGDDVMIMVFGEGANYPSVMNVNDVLPDYKATVMMTKGDNSMNMELRVNNRTCVAIEEVTVAAGTFNCFVVEENNDINQSVGDQSQSVSIKTKTWLALGVGEVKQEVYGPDGKWAEGKELINIISPEVSE